MMIHTAVPGGPNLKDWSLISASFKLSKPFRITASTFIVFSFFTFNVLKMLVDLILSDHWNVTFIQWSIIFFFVF